MTSLTATSSGLLKVREEMDKRGREEDHSSKGKLYAYTYMCVCVYFFKAHTVKYSCFPCECAKKTTESLLIPVVSSSGGLSSQNSGRIQDSQ